MRKSDPIKLNPASVRGQYTGLDQDDSMFEPQDFNTRRDVKGEWDPGNSTR